MSSSKREVLDNKENLDQCESKLEEKIKADFEKLDQVIQSGGIPQYGPTRGDRCLSPRDDETGRYTMRRSLESYNTIEQECFSKSGR